MINKNKNNNNKKKKKKKKEKKKKKMNTLNEHTVHSHPAPACHHVLALQERSPMRHILPRESGTIPKEQGVSDNPRWERKEAL